MLLLCRCPVPPPERGALRDMASYIEKVCISGFVAPFPVLSCPVLSVSLACIVHFSGSPLALVAIVTSDLGRRMHAHRLLSTFN